ncbi:MAG: Gfo/Idh/MocA family oxidoreductase [Pseudomonadota bacterium]
MMKYAIIGAGMMGQEHMRNIALLPDTRVSALADPDAEMRGAAAKAAGDLFGSVPAVFDSYQDMLRSVDVDALVVVSPNHTHHAIMADLMQTGLPILCEKPVGITEEECLDLLKWQKAGTSPVWVAMEYRYMPPMEKLVRDVASGRVGRPVQLSIREHRFPFLGKVGDWNRFNSQTGGTLVEKCCHYFDLMRLITKSDPVRLYASGGVDVNFLDESYAGEKPDILDNAFVIVDFENGMRGSLDLCMFNEASHWQEIVTITGSKASLAAVIPGPSRFSIDGKERLSEVRYSDRATKQETREVIDVDHTILSAGDHHGSTFFQHQKFKRMIEGHQDIEVSLLDGAIAVAIGAAAEESVRTGEAVSLTERISQLRDFADNC